MPPFVLNGVCSSCSMKNKLIVVMYEGQTLPFAPPKTIFHLCPFALGPMRQISWMEPKFSDFTLDLANGKLGRAWQEGENQNLYFPSSLFVWQLLFGCALEQEVTLLLKVTLFCDTLSVFFM
jgi:hypothetical protein